LHWAVRVVFRPQQDDLAAERVGQLGFQRWLVRAHFQGAQRNGRRRLRAAHRDLQLKSLVGVRGRRQDARRQQIQHKRILTQNLLAP